MLLVVGPHDPAPLRAVLNDVPTVILPARPERSELNAALDRFDGDRLVVAADDAGLGAVVRRLLRRDQLGNVAIGLLPVGPSAVRARLGLPGQLPAAAAVALTGQPSPQGLVRDDHGGVMLDTARVLPESGPTVGMRSYVDEHELVGGAVQLLTVSPQRAGLRAEVALPRRFRAHRSLTGRAVTVSCDPARIVIDGVEHGRPQTRCTWWFEPDRWRVIRPA